jgi:hypothetical protein
MRKLIYFLTFFLFLQFTVHAQKISGGIKVGVAIAKYPGSGDNSHERSGPALGAFWNVALGKYFGFQPTFNFWVQKGYNQTKTILNSTMTTTTLKINCFETQMNFVFHTTAKKINFFVGVGPSAALAINGKWTRYSGSTKSILDVKFGTKPTDDIKKGDLGVTGLLGFSWGGFLVSTCYNHGLTNLNPRSDEGAIQSTYIGINAAFLLPFEQSKTKK